MRLRILATWAAVALGWACAAHADTRVVPIDAVRVIDNGQGAYRALLRIGPIEGLSEMAISRAYLAVSTARRGGETEPLELQVQPISHDWVPEAVSWTAGWSRPGGDFHDELYSRAAIDPSELGQEAQIDVEAMVREMRHGTPCFGFVVTALPYQQLGLRSADVQRLPGLSNPRLVIEYEPMPLVVVPR